MWVGTQNVEEQTRPASPPPIISPGSSITAENFVSYGDDGVVTIRNQNGEEIRAHISALRPDYLNAILELEIHRLVVDDRFFQPEQIRAQINTHFEANPIPPDREMVTNPRGTDVTWRTIDRSLTPVEINGLILALVRLQEVFDSRYSERDFRDIMQKVRSHKNPYRRTIDAYMIANDGFSSIQGNLRIGRAGTNLLLSQATGDTIENFRARGELSSEDELRMMRNQISTSQARTQDARTEDERVRDNFVELLPYFNKFSAFRHTTTETERIRRLEEENRRRQLDEQSRDLFR
jgi:hypothetical protein